MYCIWFSFFFPPLSVMLECGQVGGARDRSTEQNRKTSACVTAYKNGSRAEGGRRGEGPNRKGTEPKEDMYNHQCGQETQQQPSDGLPRLPMPHTLAAFFYQVFLFISLNIQIIRTILSCQIKKIYRGSLGFFFPLPKKGTVNTFQREQATVKNTSLNINTIVPTLSEH